MSVVEQQVEAEPALRLKVIGEGSHAGRIGVDTWPTYHNRIEKIPGARFSKADGMWTLPLSWQSVLALGSAAGKAKIPVLPTKALGAWAKQQKADWAELSVMAQTLGDGEKVGEWYPHQIADAEWLTSPLASNGRLLLSEMGVGKTGAVIKGIDDLGVKGPILITCPKTVITTGWAAAFQRWMPDHRVVRVMGSAVQRRKALETVIEEEADVAIIGHESLRLHTKFKAFHGHALRKCEACGGAPVGPDKKPVTVAQCQTHVKEINEIPWEIIVADEIHKMRNPRAQLSQALWGAAAGAPKGVLRWGLTGTPISKEIERSWALLHFIEPEAYPVQGAFQDYFFDEGWATGGFKVITGLKPEREKEFRLAFDSVTRRVLKKQVLNLPPLLRWGSLEHEVPMGTEQRKAYDSMRKQMVAWVKEGKITAANALVQAGRLTLMANATGYPVELPDGKKTLGLKLPSNKFDAFWSDLEDGDYDGQQVGMIFESRKLLRVFHAAMVAKGILEDDIGVVAGDASEEQRAIDIDAFQAGKKRFMMLTAAAGGVGITLTAASIVAVIQRPWNSDLAAQAIDRFHRIGSEKHEAVTVVDYVSENSIEQRQITRLAENAAKQEELLHDQAKLLELFS